MTSGDPERGTAVADAAWPGPGAVRVPAWVYTDEALYRREQERIFGGPHWSYVALAAEIPAPGDYVTTAVGELPVIVVRDERGTVNVLANQCSHRGLRFCMSRSGRSNRFVCPYHQWSFDLRGELRGLPFRRGVRGDGGMPPDFDPAQHGLERLRAVERGGAVFATRAASAPEFADYLGPAMRRYFDRVFDGRELRVLGYQRHRIPANWKLVVENIKDPYHAGLLHAFLVGLRLFRADQPSRVAMDASGRHAVLSSQRATDASAADAEVSRGTEGLELRDTAMLVPAKEFPDDDTVVMQTLWPNLMIQQQTNGLALRQLQPRGPATTDLHWTYFGYADDDEEMTTRRLRQANLQGPAGLVGVDDWEVLAHLQAGLAGGQHHRAVVEMGGTGREDTDHMVTEAAIRAMYLHYRETMGL